MKYTKNTSELRLIIAGLLVGFGSQYAIKDSKSQFGLDGLPSFNFKSIFSQFLILIAACLTHTLKFYHYLPETPKIISFNLPGNIKYNTYLLVFLLIPFIFFVISKSKSFKSTFFILNNADLILYTSLFFIGIGYGYALMFSGLISRKTIYSYLSLDDKWNPVLIIILGVILLVHTVIYLLFKYLM